MWPAMSVLCPSDTHIILLTLHIAQLRENMAVEVPPWRDPSFSFFLDIPLGHGSAGGTQQFLQQR